MKKDNTINNNDDESQQVLINNLKKQLSQRRNKYNDMIYRAALLEIVNEKFPVSKEKYIDINYLPTV
jgi:hypothetical protein